ncbi:MAG: helix-turn-helix domain-containing protein [Chloroflexi bacterium]|nr:MAG: helix-turn-helix domain-containing protein [Chloroflexota bacterium]
MTEQSENKSLAKSIGEKLKSLRKAHGFSIRALAERAELSPNTISLIESNTTSPTVATLQTIANVLDIPLADFFTTSKLDDDVIFIKARDQERQISPGLNVSFFPGQILDQRIRAMHFVIEPGMNSGDDFLCHPGEELVLCLEGELDYVVKDRTYHLEKQDSLAFKENIPHSWENRYQVEAHILVLITTEADQTFHSHISLIGYNIST